MNILELKEFCGYEVTIRFEENCVIYDLNTEEFYKNDFSNTIRGKIMESVNSEVLKVIRTSFQQLISSYYKAYEYANIVKIIIPENGESISICICQ